MPIVLLYLLKLSISLAIVWLFYQLLLRRLTFYNWNRWYLLGYSMLAFFIPLINIESMFDSDLGHESLVIQFIPVIGKYTPAAGQSFTWNAWNILVAVISVGTLVLMARSVVRWVSLRKFRTGARRMDHPDIRIYEVEAPIIPFSFGNAIYINPRLHSEKEWKDIILHEYVHVKQRHTVDILLVELLCIINWYNPFAWLIRGSLRQNLEFIADQQVLENGVDKKGYQYHLLRVIGEPAYRLGNNFNFSSLKKRIIMMNTIRSARLHLVKFLFILPFIAVLLVAFRDRYGAVARQQKTSRVMAEVRVAGDARVTGSMNVVHRNIPAAEQPAHVPSLVKPARNHSIRADLHRTDTVPAKTDASQKGSWPDRLDMEKFKKALYVVDGVRMPAGWNSEKINPADIYRMEIFKGGDAMRLYGKEAGNGVIVITTNSYHKELAEKPVDLVHPLAPQPLYIIDGVEVSAAALNSINPNRVNSISVLKDASAIATYGDKGKNGVVVIALKKEDEIIIKGKDSLRSYRITVKPDSVRHP